MNIPLEDSGLPRTLLQMHEEKPLRKYYHLCKNNTLKAACIFWELREFDKGPKEDQAPVQRDLWAQRQYFLNPKLKCVIWPTGVHMRIMGQSVCNWPSTYRQGHHLCSDKRVGVGHLSLHCGNLPTFSVNLCVWLPEPTSNLRPSHGVTRIK